ncbi:hypothetical protein [Streptomyces sp. NPDC050504]|uniref:hypothetical protein n=1 Tax=Streptomyces sp. NPDC050504 TaxID=3365618 RepID=UPI003797DDA8
MGSRSKPTFLITLHGDFSLLTASGMSRNGAWAALFIPVESMRITGHTVCPAGDIPPHRLEDLGQVFAL